MSLKKYIPYQLTQNSTLLFWGIHLSCFIAFFIDFHWWYVGLAVGSYYLRMFFITGAYHRYFSHKTYETSRWFQFFLAFMAMTSSQKGVLWWASHHRHHHAHSDLEGDLHSPKYGGFWHSHAGWVLSPKYKQHNEALIRDFMKYPELVFLNKYWQIAPVTYALAITLIFGWPGLLWGFAIATTFLWHGTFTINSLSHTWGKRRYSTTDTSRNNFILSLVTLGEGWHNNHHRFQASARNGFFWYEIDITYYGLKILSWLGLIWKLRPVPKDLMDPNNKTWIKNQVPHTDVPTVPSEKQPETVLS